MLLRAYSMSFVPHETLWLGYYFPLRALLTLSVILDTGQEFPDIWKKSEHGKY